jgi:hypothetical protein
MIASGVSDAFVTEHAIRELRDFEVVGYILSHLRVEPSYDGYEALRQQVGEKGIVVGFASSHACPI